MSKIKNTPEFQRMMDELETAQSFKYQEEELERSDLHDKLSVLSSMLEASDEFGKAKETFRKALEKFQVSLVKYKEVYPDANYTDVDSNIELLSNVFKGFNPNEKGGQDEKIN